MYIMSEIRVNIEYQNIKKWEDSVKRSEHAIDRMQLRGIGIMNIKDAVRYGAKKLRADGSIVAEYRWFKVVYRQFDLEKFKKIYPITVLLENEN